jgi:hypothetical protein
MNTRSQLLCFLHSFLPFRAFHHDLTMMPVARSSKHYLFGWFVARQGRRERTLRKFTSTLPEPGL